MMETEAVKNGNNRFCGLVAIAGRPNVGKSTLLNRLLGQKLSITAHKPQTTRHSILGIHTKGAVQLVFVDTPGIHVSGSHKLNKVLNRTASSAIHDVDLILLLVQAPIWNEDDQKAYDLTVRTGTPFILVVNKIDTVKRKEALLPYLAELPSHENLKEVLLVSAKNGSGLDSLQQRITPYIPEGQWRYAEDELTDRSSRFLAAEAVREPLTRLLTAELPYALTVDIESYEETPRLVRIGAVIWVEKPSQKGIVIGKNGAQLKEVGKRARSTLEGLLGTRVYLRLWVRVKAGWADDERALRSLGYE